MNTDMQARVMVRQQRYEQLLCAAAALQPDYTRRTCGWLRPETFSDPACRKFWQGFQQHGNTDRAALDAQILSALVEWQGDELVKDASIAPELARKIGEQAWLGSIGGQLGKLAGCVGDGDSETAREVLRRLVDGAQGQMQDVPTTARTHDRFMAALRDRTRILPTHTKIDRFMAGLARQRVTLLAGHSGHGKSALALQLARNIASSGVEVCFFSLEMSEIDLWARAACGALRWNYDDILAEAASDMGLSPTKDAALERQSAALRDLYPGLHIYEDAQTTDSLWQHVAAVRPGLVVVDHLRLLKDRGDNETIRLGRMSARLKELAKALDCNVLLLTQLNRKSDARPEDDKRPTIGDVRQSGEIYENVDDMLALYRNKKQDPDADGNVPAELWFLKHRTGADGVYALFRYNLPEQWFYD